MQVHSHAATSGIALTLSCGFVVEITEEGGVTLVGGYAITSEAQKHAPKIIWKQEAHFTMGDADEVREQAALLECLEAHLSEALRVLADAIENPDLLSEPPRGAGGWQGAAGQNGQ